MIDVVKIVNKYRNKFLEDCLENYLLSEEMRKKLTPEIIENKLIVYSLIASLNLNLRKIFEIEYGGFFYYKNYYNFIILVGDVAYKNKLEFNYSSRSYAEYLSCSPETCDKILNKMIETDMIERLKSTSNFKLTKMGEIVYLIAKTMGNYGQTTQDYLSTV